MKPVLSAGFSRHDFATRDDEELSAHSSRAAFLAVPPSGCDPVRPASLTPHQQRRRNIENSAIEVQTGNYNSKLREKLLFSRRPLDPSTEDIC